MVGVVPRETTTPPPAPKTPDAAGGGVNVGAIWQIGSALTRGLNRIITEAPPTRAQTDAFIRAGGSIQNVGLPGKMAGVQGYYIDGKRVGFEQVKRIAARTPATVSPDSPTPYVPPPNYSPYIAGAAVAFPNSRQRAVRRAAKRVKKLKVPKIPPWILQRAPWLARVSKFLGPSVALNVGIDLFVNRDAYWKKYREWESKQPPSRVAVIRAPGPGQIPRPANRTRYSGPLTRPVLQRRPELTPVGVYVPRLPLPAPRISKAPGLPGSGVRVVPRNTASAARPNVAAWPSQWPTSGPWGRPAAIPRATPPSPRVTGLPAARKLANLALPFLPLLLPRGGNTRRNELVQSPSSIAPPLTIGSTYPLQSLSAYPQPAPQSAKCKCPKPRKKSTKPVCRNPRTSSRTYIRNGQKYRSTVRRIECQA